MYKCPNITFFFYILLVLIFGHPHRWDFPHVHNMFLLEPPHVGVAPPAHSYLFRNQPFMQRLVWTVGHAQSGFHFWKKQNERELWEEVGKWLCRIYFHNRNWRGLFVLRDVQMDVMWPLVVTSRQDMTPVDVVKTFYRTNFLKKKLFLWVKSTFKK